MLLELTEQTPESTMGIYFLLVLRPLKFYCANDSQSGCTMEKKQLYAIKLDVGKLVSINLCDHHDFDW